MSTTTAFKFKTRTLDQGEWKDDELVIRAPKNKMVQIYRALAQHTLGMTATWHQTKKLYRNADNEECRLVR